MRWDHAEPHPGAYLEHRFLEPLGLTSEDVSRAIRVPLADLAEVIEGRGRITAGLAARLGAYFGLRPAFWLELQAAWDLAHTGEVEVEELAVEGFLVGPAGATPLPASTPLPSPSGFVSEEVRTRIQALANASEAGAQERELVEVEYEDGLRALVSRPR